MIQATLWLAAEILLTAIGLDDLADYGEYQSAHRELSAQIMLANSTGLTPIC